MPPQLDTAAQCSGVRPLTSVALASAPPSSNATTAAVFPLAAACMSGVWDKKSFWSGCSPRSMRRVMARASPTAAASCMVLPRVPPAASSHRPLTQYRRPAPSPGRALEPGAAHASRSHARSTARRLLNSANGARSSGVECGLRSCGMPITSRVSRSAGCVGLEGGCGGAGTGGPRRSRRMTSTCIRARRDTGGPSPHSSSRDGHEHSAGARPHPSHGRTGITIHPPRRSIRAARH